MSTDSSTAGEVGRGIHEEYERLTHELFELLERKHTIEETTDGEPPDDHDEYHALIADIEYVSARMDTIVAAVIDHHGYEAAYRALV